MTDIAPAIAPIQVESTQVNAPVSESLAQTMGASINYSLFMPPVGSVISSFLDETTFQTVSGTNWVLCDGRSVVGSLFQTFTGLTNLPDMRGRYQRCKDNGSGVDTHGDLPLGTLYADQNQSHHHVIGYWNNAFVGGAYVRQNGSDLTNHLTSDSGGEEANPRTVVINYFVRIN